MSFFRAIACIITGPLLLLSAPGAPPEIEVMPGGRLERILDYESMQAFTWDDQGALWVLGDEENGLILLRVSGPGVVRSVGSFQRRGSERPGLLVHGSRAFISDGGSIRRFRIKDGNHLDEEGALIALPELFPNAPQITSLHWAPLGDIWFGYRANVSNEAGLGRVHPRLEKWDVVAKGLAGDVAFDHEGFPVATDEQSDQVFRIGLGLDYERGLQNYTKGDLALAIDKSGVKPRAVTFWPEGTRPTWIIVDAGSQTLEQFTEKEGRLIHQRELARWRSPATLHDVAIGPEGALWVLTGSEKASSLLRMAFEEPRSSSSVQTNIAALPTASVIELLTSPSAWHRETALRVLDDRDELRYARGLHPNSGLHELYNDKSAPRIGRVLGLLALHRVGLLDETMLENVVDEKEPVLRAWAALLFGERNYPTGTAFQMLVKLAKDPDINIRSAAAVAARQFVSGSLAVDTPPRAMPIREVFTGGILSTLWFSTEKSRSPAFDLHFWNAVRPISAYDSAHPMGFFNGDREEGLAIAYWTIGLITRQIAEQDHPLKQEDAMLMLGELKTSRPRMIIAALEGLKKGTPQRRVVPTAKSLNVLSKLAKNENCVIATLATEILESWKKPVVARE